MHLATAALICASAGALAGPPDHAPSVVLFPQRIATAPLADSLEAHVPRAIDSGREFVLYRPRKESESDPDSLWVRYRVDRDKFTLHGEGDRIMARARVRYWLETKGDGFGAASCGLDSAITGEIACEARIGWGDAFALDARVTPLPVVYARRCKPKPPSVNFTRLLGPMVDSSFVLPSAQVLTKVVRATTHTPATVARAWAALSELRALGAHEMWLDMEPVSVLTSPLSTAGEEITADVAIVVHPRLGTGDPPARRAIAHLPEPRVRLFDDRFTAAFDCAVRFDSLAASVARHCAAESIAVTDVRVARRDSAVSVVLEVAGAGRAELHGTPHFDPSQSVLSIAGLSYANAPAALGAAREEKLRAAVAAGVRCDVSAGIAASLARLGRGINSALTPDLALSGGAMRREVVGLWLADHLVAVRILAAGKVRLTHTPLAVITSE